MSVEEFKTYIQLLHNISIKNYLYEFDYLNNICVKIERKWWDVWAHKKKTESGKERKTNKV